MFNSGSSANLALLTALKHCKLLNARDCVGFSALTWATNVMPITQCGFIPVAIDVDLKHLNLSIEELIENKAKIDALFITNALGFGGDLEKIREICKDYKILLLEDNCESLGSKIGNTKLGNFGFASTFSFFVGHHLSTIEGGMVCTDDEELYEMLKMVRAHGWTRNNSEIVCSNLKFLNKVNDFYDNYTFYYDAYNFRPTEINGFLGLNQLQHIDVMNVMRELNFNEFSDCVKKNKDIYDLDVSHMSFVSNFAFPLVFKSKDLFLKYLAKFKAANIAVRPIIGGNMTKQPFYLGYRLDNEVATYIHENGLYFPNNPELTREEITIIKGVLENDGER